MGDPTTNQSMSPMPPSKPDMPLWKKRKVVLKELTLSEIPRNIAWERRRHLKLMQEKKMEDAVAAVEDHDVLSDDLNELKGSIELGFGFNEEEGGQSLTNTLPALDLYFAVNRLGSPTGSTSPVPKLEGIGASSSKSGESSFGGEDSWKICSPGEDPQQVKTKLRHWAQAVACSVIQST